MINISPILLVPSDTPPSTEYIKKLCIFFPKIIIPHHNDQALINIGDIVDKFPSIEIGWAERYTYPRSDNYVDSMSDLINSSTIMQKRNIIHILDKESIKNITDPGAHYLSFCGLSSNEKIVKSAIPDANPNITPKLWGNYFDFKLAPEGYSSKYQIEDYKSAEVKGYPQEWSLLALQRLGRFIKYNNLAMAAGYNLSYYGRINADISKAYNAGVNENSFARKAPSLEHLTFLLFENMISDAALSDMSWIDVLEIRKQFMQNFANILNFIEKIAKRYEITNEQNFSITNIVNGLEKDYLKLREDYLEALEKFRISTMLGLGRALIFGGGVQVLLQILSGANYIQGLIASIGTTLPFAIKYKEIVDVYLKRKRLKKHILHFFDRTDGISSI